MSAILSRVEGVKVCREANNKYDVAEQYVGYGNNYSAVLYLG
jgi:hypothetical protein